MNLQDLLADDLAKRIADRILPMLRSESGSNVQPKLLSIKDAAKYLAQGATTIRTQCCS